MLQEPEQCQYYAASSSAERFPAHGWIFPCAHCRQPCFNHSPRDMLVSIHRYECARCVRRQASQLALFMAQRAATEAATVAADAAHKAAVSAAAADRAAAMAPRTARLRKAAEEEAAAAAARRRKKSAAQTGGGGRRRLSLSRILLRRRGGGSSARLIKVEPPLEREDGA